MSVTICTIIPTFNRPTMLAKALSSVWQADQIIVVDDGSTYDVRPLCANHGVRDIVSAPPMTPEERMTTPRQGRLLNQALELVRCDVVTYLCDDDLHAPGWYSALRQEWAANPERLLVRGNWLVFQDGDTPEFDNPPCPMDPARGMTAGNFAHHASLTRDRGARWDERRFNCLDSEFLHALHAAGADQFRAYHLGCVAGWRREHPLTNSNYSDGQRHTPAFLDVLRGGLLEVAR